MGVTNLRDRIHGDELVIAPEVFSPLTARIAEDAGFDTAIMGGGAASASLGIPEPVLTMTEMRDLAQRVSNTSTIDIVIDGTTGFGNASHTYRTVKEFANAGVAGVFIEDQIAPPRLYHDESGLELLDADEMGDKLRAAVRAREDVKGDIVIFAKTQVATKDRSEYEDIDDVVERMRHYFDAGAEVGCIYPTNEKDARYAAEQLDGPLKFTVVPKKPFCPDFETVDDMGYAVANTPTVGTATAVKQYREYYEGLYDDGTLPVDGDDVENQKSYVRTLLYEDY